MTRRQEIMSFVNRKITLISNSHENGKILAELRRGAGKIPGDSPEALWIILEDMPETFLSPGLEPSKEEWACYLALTLYALHQRGQDPITDSVNSDAHMSLGSAMAKFVRLEGDANAKMRLVKRLERLAYIDNMETANIYLRSIVALLKTKNVPLNYPELAADLYAFQYEDGKKRILFKWYQDLFSNKYAKTQGKEDSTPDKIIV